MAVSSVSYTNTPQAGDDTFNRTEDWFNSNYTASNTILWDVLANDLGGNAKKLYSIDDGEGATALRDLLASDVGKAMVSAWESTADGNQIRINSGKIEFKFAEGFDINSLKEGEAYSDSFNYAIQLGNGTISYATVRINVTGQNDGANIVGDTAGKTTEDGTLTAGGKLTIADLDRGEAHAKAYSSTIDEGTFSVDKDGNWQFDLNNDAIQHLAKDATLTKTFAVQSLDGTASQDVTITITGANDAASISGTATGGVKEDDTLSATGKLTVSDVDDGEAHAKATSSTVDEGTFSVKDDGSWTFDLNNDALQHLAQDATLTKTFAVQSQDGTASQDVTVTITGTNDAATISGTATGDVKEDDTLSATGKLTVSDVDDGEAHAKAASSSIDEGTFSVKDDGSWTFDLNNDAVQHLAQDATLTKTFAVQSLDGTASQDVTVTITGTNDAPIVANPLTAAGTEDHAAVTVNLLAGASDVDDGARLSATDIGSLPAGVSVADNTLTIDPTDAAFQHLAAGVTEDIVVAYKVTDEHGAAVDQTATVTITGVNDLASIGVGINDAATGQVKEDGTLTASGKLTVGDVDDGEAYAKAYSSAIDEGTFSVDKDGNWTFGLNNDAVQYLSGDAGLTRTFTVKSLDGSASQDVTIAIAGADEPLVRAAAPAVYTGTGDSNDFDGAGDGPLPTLVTYTNNQLNGDNIIRGTNGSDTIDAKSGVDTIYGYNGNDSLSGGQDTDTIYGGAGKDAISGDSQSDTIYGGSDDDTIYGGSDNDVLYGGSGNDTISGDSNNDIIIGGYGADILTGNDGTDTYKFLSVRDTGDTIAFGAGDKLDFSAIDAKTTTAGDDAFAFVAAQSKTLQANSINWFSENGNTVVQFDNDGNTATAEFEIKLTGTVTLTQGDFVL
ncbi:MAG: Type secretory pathway [Rhodocyclaceae bacterium]|nr:Type secretory pathway [Rhodocyclaceae bacterium]